VEVPSILFLEKPNPRKAPSANRQRLHHHKHEVNQELPAFIKGKKKEFSHE
jgi:hypothetical protein